MHLPKSANRTMEIRIIAAGGVRSARQVLMSFHRSHVATARVVRFGSRTQELTGDTDHDVRETP
jgi:hypothetical protein